MADQQPVDTPADRLPLGGDPMGRTWTLNLGTGAIEAETHGSLVEGLNTEIVPPSALNGVWVARVLAEGGWNATPGPAEPAGGWSFSVVTEIGDVEVSVTRDGRWVCLDRVYRWNTEHDNWATVDERGKGTEGLNRVGVVVRFATTEEPATLSASFHIPTHAGITRAQLLQYLRRFVLQVTIALEQEGISEAVR
jgi:hypothetical protein